MSRCLLSIVQLFVATAMICFALVRELKADSTSQPAVSWETIPRGICIWKNKPFTEQDIKAVAKYSLVQTMIPNGIPWRPVRDDDNIALRIKRYNPHCIVIGYKNIVVHYDYHATPDIFKDHPNWFIYDSMGKPVMHKNKRPVHDLRQRPMRQWWVQDVHRLLTTPGFDGILVDAITKVYFYEPIISALTAQEHEDYINAFHAMMQETKTRCGGQGLLIGNCLRVVHDDAGLAILRKYYDGSYLESFTSPMKLPRRQVSSPEEWIAKGIEAVQRAASEDKLIFLSLFPGEYNNNDVADVKAKSARGEFIDYEKLYSDREYKLALFLICAGERSYLGYQYSRNASDDPRLWNPDFPEFHKPLGRPKGPAIKNGFRYKRQFEHASVYLDLGKRKGRIIWRPPNTLPKERHFVP